MIPVRVVGAPLTLLGVGLGGVVGSHLRMAAKHGGLVK